MSIGVPATRWLRRANRSVEQARAERHQIARRVERFGQIAHVWSTYASRHDLSDPKPFMRGINSFQLFNDGKRWWIVSIYWQHENAQHSLPEKYL